MRLLLTYLILFFPLFSTGPTYAQEGTAFFPMSGFVFGVFAKDSDKSRMRRSEKNLRVELGASSLGGQAALMIPTGQDFSYHLRYNVDLFSGKMVDLKAYELGARYYFWNRFFLEADIFASSHRRKGYFVRALNSDPCAAVPSWQQSSACAYEYTTPWSNKATSYGAAAGIGAEAQYSYISLGVLFLIYRKAKTVERENTSSPGYSTEEIEEINRTNREIYSKRQELSAIFGWAF